MGVNFKRVHANKNVGISIVMLWQWQCWEGPVIELSIGFHPPWLLLLTTSYDKGQLFLWQYCSQSSRPLHMKIIKEAGTEAANISQCSPIASETVNATFHRLSRKRCGRPKSKIRPRSVFREPASASYQFMWNSLYFISVHEWASWKS